VGDFQVGLAEVKRLVDDTKVLENGLYLYDYAYALHSFVNGIGTVLVNMAVAKVPVGQNKPDEFPV
jgi:hypothetical protein